MTADADADADELIVVRGRGVRWDMTSLILEAVSSSGLVDRMVEEVGFGVVGGREVGNISAKGLVVDVSVNAIQSADYSQSSS